MSPLYRYGPGLRTLAQRIKQITSRQHYLTCLQHSYSYPDACNITSLGTQLKGHGVELNEGISRNPTTSNAVRSQLWSFPVSASTCRLEWHEGCVYNLLGCETKIASYTCFVGIVEIGYKFRPKFAEPIASSICRSWFS